MGAYTLAVISSILLVLNVSAYYSTVVEGAIIVLAVLGSSSNDNTQVRDVLRRWMRGTRVPASTTRDGLPAHSAGRASTVRLASADAPVRIDPDLRGSRLQKWASYNHDTLQLVLPSYVLLLFAIAIARLAFGTGGASLAQYGNSLLVLTAFAAILGLGQGAVILTGGLDLSIPWTIGLSGALVCGWVNGANTVTSWAVPVILLLGSSNRVA